MNLVHEPSLLQLGPHMNFFVQFLNIFLRQKSHHTFVRNI